MWPKCYVGQEIQRNEESERRYHNFAKEQLGELLLYEVR